MLCRNLVVVTVVLRLRGWYSAFRRAEIRAGLVRFSLEREVVVVARGSGRAADDPLARMPPLR